VSKIHWVTDADIVCRLRNLH